MTNTVSIARWVAAFPPIFPLLATAALAVGVPPANAATVLQAEVTESHGSYRMSFEAVLQAPYPRIHALLTDYPGLPRFNPHIQDITLLPTSERGSLRMRVVSRPCVLVFCKRVTHVQQVREHTPGDIVATVIPEESDLRRGLMSWRVVPEGDRTRIVFQGDMTPAFWVPPLIGPAAIKHSLRSEAIALVENLERGATRPVAPKTSDYVGHVALGWRAPLD